MHVIELNKTLNAPIAKLWALVEDFTNLDWYPNKERVEASGSGPGAVRLIYMAGMPAPVEEVLDSIDAQTHIIEYHIELGDTHIMEDYTVKAQLHAVDEQTTRAHWYATFSGVKDNMVPAEDMVAVMEQTYGGMLDALEKAAVQ